MPVTVVAIGHVTVDVALRDVFVGVAVPAEDRRIVGVTVVAVVVAVAVLVADRRVVVGMEVVLGEEQADPARHGQADGDLPGTDRFTEGDDREQGAEKRGGGEQRGLPSGAEMGRA